MIKAECDIHGPYFTNSPIFCPQCQDEQDVKDVMEKLVAARGAQAGQVPDEVGEIQKWFEEAEQLGSNLKGPHEVDKWAARVGPAAVDNVGTLLALLTAAMAENADKAERIGHWVKRLEAAEYSLSRIRGERALRPDEAQDLISDWVATLPPSLHTELIVWNALSSLRDRLSNTGSEAVES